jgi:hypothetical protein
MSPRVAANKKNGSRGGLATAAKMSPEERSSRGELGGTAVRDRYGSDFYKHLTKLRKTSGWKKGRARKSKVITPEVLYGLDGPTAQSSNI